jgi:hypothetical protein
MRLRSPRPRSRELPSGPTLTIQTAASRRHARDRPDDYGKVRVSCKVVALSSQHIAIRRHDPRAGEMVVYFPRAGFRVLPA